MEKIKKYHHGNLDKDFIEQATAFIEKNGGEKISIRALAKKLDVKSSSFYHHFDNKEIFLKKVAIGLVNTLVTKIENDQKQISDEGVLGSIKRFRMLGDAYITSFYDNPNLFRFVMYQANLSGLELRELSLYTLLQKNVAELRAHNALDENIKNVEDFIWSITHGIGEMCARGMISLEDAQSLLENFGSFFNKELFV